MSYLVDKYDVYLTDYAKLAIDIMTAKGVDKDLAIAILEMAWPDDMLYSISDYDEKDPKHGHN